MSLHFGPSALCFSCGQQLDHVNLMGRHRLSCPALAPRKSTMRLKCPHPLCNAMSHSRMQLHQHLKKHSGRKCYQCLQCRRFFESITSSLIHREGDQECSEAKLLTLFQRHKKLGKGKSDPRRCTVCLKRFSCESNCMRHQRKCILGHHNRLSKTDF
ncbi:hypothetical protein M5D96_013332 [Drosophila gunungcola]|uniref:C2H2-type domain-containing protein n=1 Tax=Drosophila gunungcola TaxID=103775 RepID=A0A9Q0BIY3_9MUSC|nr:hypothetical protein M5D96_013332 [Drosophila gunungcola]